MKTNGTEEKIQIWIHEAVPTCFLTKVPKIYNGEKTISSTNVAGKTGYPHAENSNQIPVILVTLDNYQLKNLKSWNL
jgi:hypothetical protein